MSTSENPPVRENPEEVVRKYLSGMIRNKGIDAMLSENGRRFAFARTWAAIQYYRWSDNDPREPFVRLADLIEDPSSRDNDNGLKWLGKHVAAAVEEARDRGLCGGLAWQEMPNLDSEQVSCFESLASGPEEAAWETELREGLKNGIAELAELTRAMLQMKLEGFTNEAIAQKFNKGTGTVHRRLEAARRFLADFLDGHK